MSGAQEKAGLSGREGAPPNPSIGATVALPGQEPPSGCPRELARPEEEWMLLPDDIMVVGEVVVVAEAENVEAAEVEVPGDQEGVEKQCEAQAQVAEWEQQGEMREAEDKRQDVGTTGNAAQQPAEPRPQEPGLRHATAQEAPKAPELLQGELCSLSARETRALWPLKRRILRKQGSHLDQRRAVIQSIPGFWAQAVSFLLPVGFGVGFWEGAPGQDGAPG